MIGHLLDLVVLAFVGQRVGGGEHSPSSIKSIRIADEGCCGDAGADLRSLCNAPSAAPDGLYSLHQVVWHMHDAWLWCFRAGLQCARATSRTSWHQLACMAAQCAARSAMQAPALCSSRLEMQYSRLKRTLPYLNQQQTSPVGRSWTMQTQGQNIAVPIACCEYTHTKAA